MNGGLDSLFHYAWGYSSGGAVDGMWKRCKPGEECRGGPQYGVSSTIECPYEQGVKMGQVAVRK
jgi:hypothetical protein